MVQIHICRPIQNIKKERKVLTLRGRTTVYNQITTKENLSQINPDNQWLISEFLEHLRNNDRSRLTIEKYENALQIFFVWNLQRNDNKKFVNIKKREFEKFQGWGLNEWRWSASRVKFVHSVISSLTTFVEDYLTDEEGYENFRSALPKSNISSEMVREKSVLTDGMVQLLLDTLVERKAYEKALCVAILAYSGMRKAELLQMKMSYFEPECIKFGCVYITPKVRGKGRGVIGKPQNKYILNRIDPYLELWRKERERLGVDNEYVFVIKRGDFWDKREYIDCWKDEFSKILDVPVYPHAFRHYFTTMAKNDYGLPDELLTLWNSWSSADMISRYNDITVEDTLHLYFNENGVIRQDKNKDMTVFAK